MGALQIDMACAEYELLRPLRDGAVRAEGIEINFIPINRPPEVHWRMAIHGEFDAAEMSLGTYVAGRSRGEFPLIAVPAFVYRRFRHSSAYVGVNSGIGKPEDLKGKRVGIPEYQMTATVWLRGILQDDYGLRPSDLRWFAGGLEYPGRKEKVPLNLPPEVRLEMIPEGKTLSAMLEGGEIDALFSASVPELFAKRSPKVRRLFSDSRRVEADYYRRTGIFPIMHVVVIREETYRKHPWVAQSLFKALAEAKKLCIESTHRTHGLHSILPWAGDHFEEMRDLMGQDLWPYGVEANRKTLETFLRYTREQGISGRNIGVEELFAKETLDTVRV